MASQTISNIDMTGNQMLFDLPSIFQDPVQYLLKLTEKYGDFVTIDIRDFFVIIVSNPDVVQHVFVNNHRNYTKDTIQFKTFSYVTGNGLLNSDGDFWLKQRRIAQPAFHRKRLATMGQLIVDSAEIVAQNWERKIGQTVDIEHEMLEMSLPIICQALFSLDIANNATAINNAFTHTLDYVMFRSRFPYELPSWAPVPVSKRYHKGMALLNELIDGMIAERRAGVRRDDLLDMLIFTQDADTGERMSDQQVRDEIMTMILAGYETVATGLTWMWQLLDQHPQIESEMLNEITTRLEGRTPTLDDLPHLPYLRMVMDEAWRLYPPSWLISRRAKDADQIGDSLIPANALVVLSPYVVHRNEAFWPNPELFDPTRFSAENKKAQHPYAYVPFGGGPRLCIGARFAEMEAMLVVATLAQRFKLVGAGDVPYKALVTIRPKKGLPMRIEKR